MSLASRISPTAPPDTVARNRLPCRAPPSVTPPRQLDLQLGRLAASQRQHLHAAATHLDRRLIGPSGAMHGDPHRELPRAATARHHRRTQRHQQVVAQHAHPLGDLAVIQRADGGQRPGTVDRELGDAQRPHAVEQELGRLGRPRSGGDGAAAADQQVQTLDACPRHRPPGPADSALQRGSRRARHRSAGWCPAWRAGCAGHRRPPSRRWPAAASGTDGSHLRARPGCERPGRHRRRRGSRPRPPHRPSPRSGSGRRGRCPGSAACWTAPAPQCRGGRRPASAAGPRRARPSAAASLPAGGASGPGFSPWALGRGLATLRTAPSSNNNETSAVSDSLPAQTTGCGAPPRAAATRPAISSA